MITADRLRSAMRMNAARSLAAGAIVLAIIAGVLFAPPAGAEVPARGVPTEVPQFRRVFLTPDQTPGVRDKERGGVLRALARPEFEDKVKRAARAAQAIRHPPRLAEAHYRARLTDSALAGTGVWKVIHTASGAGLLPLQPLNLALDRPRLENRDALIADFDGKSPSLLLDEPGDHAVSFEWSARAEERPEGLHFDLKLPACPAAALELELPADRIAASADGSLLSGPLPTDEPNQFLWRVACGDRTGVELWVRRSGAAAPPTLLFARQFTTQTLEPEGLSATYQFELELLHREVDELSLECDPELRPYEVAVPGLERWELHPPATAGAPARMTIRLRQPLRHGRETLTVRCLAPLRKAAQAGQQAASGSLALPPVDWQSPAMRLKHSVPRGETIVLLVDPELRIDELTAGDFQQALGSPELTAGGRGSLQRFTFAGGAVADSTDLPRRPAARIQPYAVEYRARQLVWWQPTANPPSLSVQIACEVQRGRLFQLPVLLPDGWDVERVELTPASLLRNWSVRPILPEEVPADSPGGNTGRLALVVDLQRPLTSDTPPRGTGVLSGVGALFGRARAPTLVVRLIQKQGGTAFRDLLQFPDIATLGARVREGLLAIGCDPQTCQMTLKASVPETEPEDDGPWGRQAPAAVYPYRGRPIEGTLLLRQRPLQVRSRCSSEVYLPAGRAGVNIRLILEAESGNLESVDLSLSASPHPAPGSPRAADDHGPEGWQWHVEQGDNSVRGFERLRAREAAEGLTPLAGANAVGLATLLAARPPGERWRLTLDRPVRPHSVVVLHASRWLEPEAGRWEVPLPVIMDARQMDGEVTLHLGGAEFVQVEAKGLQEVSPATPAPGRPGTPWRTFRYADNAVSLVLRGRGASVDRVAEVVADRTRLTTYLADDGAARHHFSFRVANWPQRTLPLRLPRGAKIVAVRVDRRSASLSPGTNSTEPGVVELPVPGSANGSVATPLQFDVFYDTMPPTKGGWQPVAKIESPVPVLPVTPLTFHRTWRLPPGMIPISEGRLRRLPGAGESAADGVPRILSERLLLATPLPDILAQHPAASGQAEGLAAAAVGLRPKVGRRVARLRELVSELSAGFLDGRLVVDDAALREIGTGAESLLALDPSDRLANQSPPWETLGLVAVGAGPATLLTTATRAGQWRRASDPPDPVKAAVATALANGHDSSGHYRSAANWVRHATDRDREEAADLAPEFGLAFGPWTEWEPLAGVADDAAIVVVQRDFVLVGGTLLATLVLPLLWLCRRRDLVLIGWIGLAGLAAFWLPSAVRPLAWLPLLGGALLALLGYLRVVARRPQQVSIESGSGVRPTLTAVSVLVVLSAVCHPGTADEPAAVPVYILSDASSNSNNEIVLAPPELLDRLDVLARSSPEGTEPVLLGTSYEGKVADAIAVFDAAFEAYSPAGKPTVLALPMESVYLEDNVLVDGVLALPTTLPPPQNGFSVALSGAGRHKIEFRFRVPVLDEVGGRGIRFGAPRASQSRLRLALSPGATAAQALVRHGAQRVTTEDGHPVLRVDLGRVTAPLHFRWTPEGQVGNAVVREAYLWDLTPECCTLTACLDYHVTDGSLSSMAVDLPPGLDVQRAEARRVGPGDPVRLRNWQVTGSDPGRVLTLELASPGAAAFQIGLTLVPPAPFPTEVTLPLPRPRARASAEGSHLAYRANGLTATLLNTRWLTGGATEAFAPFWPATSRPDPQNSGDAALAYAATFHRESGQAPLLRLRLAPASARLRVEHLETTVRVSAHRADVEAALRIATPDGCPAEMSCNIHPAEWTIADVRGDGVRRWTQADDKLTIWFEGDGPGKRRNAASLQITGWLPVDEQGARLNIPSLRVKAAEVAQQPSVRLLPETGLTLAPAGLNGLRQVPAAEPELAFVAERPDYDGACEIRAGAAGAAVKVLTLVEIRDHRLAFRSVVEFLVKKGELRAATVRLRNWEGEDVKLDVEKTVPLRLRERRRAASDRTWALELAPGITSKFRLTLSASVSLADAAAGASMPEVSVPGTGPADMLVGIVGTDLSPDAADGLTGDESLAATSKLWPAEANHLRLTGGQVWRVTRDDWALRLRPRGGAGAGPVQVLLTDCTAALADGQHWLHEVVYWIRHGANSELNIVLPRPATVVAVAADGVDVAPLQPEQRRLWLPLPGRAGVRAIRICWRYREPADPLERPLLQAPIVEGAVAGPVVWTVYLPGGFETASNQVPELKAGPARAASIALYRAAAQLRVSESLAQAADGGTAPLAGAQQRFYAYCRQVEQMLQLADDDDGQRGPAGESCTRWLQSLRDEDRALAREQKFEEIRAEAEQRAANANSAARPVMAQADPGMLTGSSAARIRGSLPDNGTPTYACSMEPGTFPRLTIRRSNERVRRETIADTAVWVALFVSAAALAFLPGVLSRLRRFWPELLLVLGLLAWYHAGVTPVASLFLLLGIGGRVLVLMQDLRLLVRPRRDTPTIAGGAVAPSSGS